MANTLTGLVPLIFEALDTVSRELVAVVGAVTTDSKVERAAQNQSVTSFATQAATASNIAPGVTAPNDGDQTFGTKSITLDKAQYVPIRWNGEEQRSISTANGGPGSANIARDQFAQAFRTLGNAVEADVIAATRRGASRATGTGGTPPFSTNGDLQDSAAVMRILTDNGAPQGNRQLCLGPGAMAGIRGKQAVLFRVNEAGTDQLLRQGVIGQLQGMAVREASQIGAVAAGTGASYTTNTAGYAIGATSITLITGTGTILQGDSVTFAGDANKYVVATGIAAPGTIVLAAPGLRRAIPAAATAVTVGSTGSSYEPSLAFAKSAIVLASRLPALPVDAAGNAADMADDRMTVTDPVSGLSFEVSLYRQYRQIRYEVALVWGVSVIKPEHVVQLLG